MNLVTTIKVNKQIMALIKSKYPDDFPLAYHGTDAIYYERLAAGIVKAEAFSAAPAQLERDEVIEGAGARQ